MLWIELAVLLGCIVVGARLGGIALGAVSGIGLAVFVFVFGLPPGSPPTTVLGMILAVITALSAMQAAGGLDWLLAFAERVLRRNPKRVTVLAPLVAYALIFVSGTQHVLYALLPIIAEVSRKAGVRPERPLSISVVAAQQGLIASPVSAVTVALVGSNVGLPQILMVVIPASLVGVACGTLSVMWRGAELADDPVYAARLAEGAIKPAAEVTAMSEDARRRAAGSCFVFFAAIVLVVLLGLFPDLRPVWETTVDGVTSTGQIEMGRAIMVIMLAAAGLMMLLFGANPEAAVKGAVMKGGLIAFVSILGVSWLGSSFFEANRATIVGGISALVVDHPGVFAVGLFVLSILLMSQAATIVTLLPVAVAIGMDSSLLVGLYPAVNGTFFLPTYGTILAAVAMDQTGTTRIGNWLVDHSFMRPGLVSTVTSTAAALALSRIFVQGGMP